MTWFVVGAHLGDVRASPNLCRVAPGASFVALSLSDECCADFGKHVVAHGMVAAKNPCICSGTVARS